MPALMTMGALGTALSIGGMGLSVLGQIQAGNAEADAMKANAAASRMEAKSIQEATKAETLRLSREKRMMVGQQAAIFGGAGVDPSSGSPLDVMATTVANYENDIQQLGYMGDTRAAAKVYEASIYDWMAPQKRRAGWLGAGTSLVGGMGTFGKNRGWF